MNELFTESVYRLILYDFKYSPLVIKIASISIIIAVISTIVVYFSILRKRYVGYRDEKRLAKINPLIDNIITDKVIFHDGVLMDLPLDEIQIDISDFQKPIFRKEWAREALVNRIISYRKNLKGIISDALRLLYIDLELDKESFKKMKSTRWDKKVQALVELTNMDMSIADVIILPLTNSNNRELRAEARHAYIKLSKNEPFKFFDVITEPLLMWDQIELFKIITSTEDISIPNFAQWVTYSPNKSIISFCLKLIIYYNQVEAIPAVENLLNSNDHYLRADAINCLGKMKVDTVEDKLINIYSNQPHNCQLEILKAIGRIESGKYIEFLKREFLHSTDFDVRKGAAKSLIKIEYRAKDLIKDLMESSTKENLLILKHCMNPLIKY